MPNSFDEKSESKEQILTLRQQKDRQKRYYDFVWHEVVIICDVDGLVSVFCRSSISE
jgi:hypothetical protein